MRTIKLTLAYDGTAYAGWQYQPQRKTLQGIVEDALGRITGETVCTVASGRTDAGVHAAGQVVSFRTASRLPAEVLRRALNAVLPADVAVLDAEEAPAGFHATHHAVRKRYRYMIHDGPVRDVFRLRYAWQCRRRLDAEAMDRAAKLLLGTHDFRSFQATGSKRTSTVRTVFDLEVRRGGKGESDLVTTEIEADGFLYNMVRTIVGTLVEVGRGARPESWVADVLAAKDRSAAGRTAPAQGLFLLNVEYE
jgi:tRNA pseudouridine38-40 synthase